VRSLGIALVLLVLIAPAGIPVHAQVQELPPDAVIQIALQTASDNLGVSTDNLWFVMAAQRDWSDSALGCPEAGRAYSQIVTPGFLVTIDTSDLVTEIEVHTDRGSRGVIC
jgi:hypothetical protein